jgi:hypothetical protein
VGRYRGHAMDDDKSFIEKTIEAVKEIATIASDAAKKAMAGRKTVAKKTAKKSAKKKKAKKSRG